MYCPPGSVSLFGSERQITNLSPHSLRSTGASQGSPPNDNWFDIFSTSAGPGAGLGGGGGGGGGGNGVRLTGPGGATPSGGPGHGPGSWQNQLGINAGGGGGGGTGAGGVGGGAQGEGGGEGDQPKKKRRRQALSCTGAFSLFCVGLLGAVKADLTFESFFLLHFFGYWLLASWFRFRFLALDGSIRSGCRACG